MIDKHNYYKALQTEDLVELLANASQKYSHALAIGLSERTLESYRELMDLLNQEIQLRATAQELRQHASDIWRIS